MPRLHLLSDTCLDISTEQNHALLKRMATKELGSAIITSDSKSYINFIESTTPLILSHQCLFSALKNKSLKWHQSISP